MMDGPKLKQSPLSNLTMRGKHRSLKLFTNTTEKHLGKHSDTVVSEQM